MAYSTLQSNRTENVEAGFRDELELDHDILERS